MVRRGRKKLQAQARVGPPSENVRSGLECVRKMPLCLPIFRIFYFIMLIHVP